jgi:hypothetical protein
MVKKLIFASKKHRPLPDFASWEESDKTRTVGSRNRASGFQSRPKPLDLQERMAPQVGLESGSPAGMTSATGYTDFALGTIALVLSLQLKTGTLMAEGNAALLSHYGILVRRRSPEAAWALTFPAPPGGKPA